MELFRKKTENGQEITIPLFDENSKSFYQYRMQFLKRLGDKNLYQVATRIERAKYDETINLSKAKRVTIPPQCIEDKPIQEKFLLRVEPSVTEAMEEPEFADEILLLLDPHRIRERLLRENEEIQKHYLYYRMGKEDKVLAQTTLYVGSLQVLEDGVYRAYTEEDRSYSSKYVTRENRRIEAEFQRIKREKEWKQACAEKWNKILEESKQYQKEKKENEMKRRMKVEDLPYQPKHARATSEEEIQADVEDGNYQPKHAREEER